MLSALAIATKLYGVVFFFIIFFFIVVSEWQIVRRIGLFKLKTLKDKLKYSIKEYTFWIPAFIMGGMLLGAVIQRQLVELWNGSGEKGRENILGTLPDFLDNIVLHLHSTESCVFFIAMGVIIAMLIWCLVSVMGKEFLRCVLSLIHKRELDKKYHLLIFSSGAFITFLIVYLPYLINPVSFFADLLTFQTMNLQEPSPRLVAGTLYSYPPWWSYFYWIYEYIGVVLIFIPSCTFMFAFFWKEIDKAFYLLLGFAFIPLILLSALSMKHPNYMLMLFPFFIIITIYTVDLTTKKEFVYKQFSYSKVWASLIIPLVMLSSFTGMLEPKEIGHDSGYDEAGIILMNYVELYNKEIYVITEDIYALGFYINDDFKDLIHILPLRQDNFSKDSVGREIKYYQKEIDRMLSNGTIDFFVGKEPIENSLLDFRINDDLAIYWMSD